MEDFGRTKIFSDGGGEKLEMGRWNVLRYLMCILSVFTQFGSNTNSSVKDKQKKPRKKKGFLKSLFCCCCVTDESDLTACAPDMKSPPTSISGVDNKIKMKIAHERNVVEFKSQLNVNAISIHPIYALRNYFRNSQCRHGVVPLPPDQLPNPDFPTPVPQELENEARFGNTRTDAQNSILCQSNVSVVPIIVNQEAQENINGDITVEEGSCNATVADGVINKDPGVDCNRQNGIFSNSDQVLSNCYEIPSQLVNPTESAQSHHIDDRHHLSHPDTFNLRPPDWSLPTAVNFSEFDGDTLQVGWIQSFFQTKATQNFIRLHERYHMAGNAYENGFEAAVYLQRTEGISLTDITTEMLLRGLKQKYSQK